MSTHSRFVQAALALLLASETLTSVSATVNVCGVDYTDASFNCKVSQGCPLGDGCPPEAPTCFSIPDNQCFDSPTPAPSVSPTTAPPTASSPPTLSPVRAPLNICGATYGDALSNCNTAPQCPGGDGALCGDDTLVCYEIPADICSTGVPTPNPVEGVATVATTTTTIATVTTTTTTTASAPTVSPTTSAPTVTPPFKVCGVGFAEAEANCLDTAKRCPTGDGCNAGEACFNVAADACGNTATVETIATVASENVGSTTVTATATAQDISVTTVTTMDGEPTLSPTPGPIKTCGTDYGDATTNCLTNPGCPNGDGCPSGYTCFALEAGSCPDEVSSSPTAKMTTAATTMAPTPKATSEPTTGPTPDPTMAQVIATPEPTSEPTPDPTMAQVATVAATVITDVGTNAPTAKATAPTMLSVCGSDYTDATQNLCTNQACPSGDGCADGGVCYALPYVDCNAPDPTTTVAPEVVTTVTVATEPAATTTEAADATTEAAATTPDATTLANVSLEDKSPSKSPTTENPTGSPNTNAPSKAPIFNKFFCGETYQFAEENCWIAEACPSGTCSKSTEQCYGISVERCTSPAPTDAPTPTPAPTGPGPRPSSSPTISPAPSSSPTISPMPTSTPTMTPSRAPIVNTNFCGTEYFEAEANCSEENSCAIGLSCPNGLTCYSGIQCAATATTPTPTVVIVDGGEPTTVAVVSGGSTTSSPTTLFQGLFGNTSAGTTNKPTSAVTGVVLQRFCGSSSDNAKDMCATAIACPNGLSDVCLQGQSCFPIDSCDTGASGTIGQPTNGQPTTNTDPSFIFNNQPTYEPTKKAPFDPNNNLYCGADYDDANENCYLRTPCPNGAKEECPSEQMCYTVNSCETPPPSMSVAPTNAPQGAEFVESDPTARPTTAKPTWNFDSDSLSSSSAKMGYCSLFLKSFVLGGVILGAVVF